jgi:pimeloyl-ACP methyl ester carboxylesterase
MMVRPNQLFQMPGGRRLGFNEYGPSDGDPVFYFHGSPSARNEFELFSEPSLLESLRVRLIAVDRPGVGLSDFQPNRRLLDWPMDVAALADGLQIDRFAVLAYSLGGPYGLACAWAIPDRLTRLAVVSGAALFTDPALMEGLNKGTRRYLALPRDHPTIARIFLWILAATARYAPRIAVTNASALLPEADREVVADSAIQKAFIAMVREAMRQGTQGAFHESLLTVSDWGFRLEDIQMTVHLWNGEEDQSIPVAMARRMVAVLPDSKARIIPGEGHLSLIKKNLGEIIRVLVQRDARNSGFEVE